MLLLSPSAISINKKGERGSPCLIPLEGRNVGEVDPLIRIEKKEEEMSDMIHWVQVG